VKGFYFLKIDCGAKLNWGALQLGLGDTLHVREERLSMKSNACKILYISDIHLRRGRSSHLCRQIVEAAQNSNAELILLGGDLVDARQELANLRDLVSKLSSNATVLAVGGNHDRSVGMSRVRDAVESGGGHWIHSSTFEFSHGSRVISISGPENHSITDADIRVLCAHNPKIWKKARHNGYDLVLAGHLHGCQVVAFEYRDRLFPGAFFYPYCFRSHQRGSTRFVVSRGVSDLVPIRWRCPREVILCHV
jgi:uncharacterized protein